MHVEGRQRILQTGCGTLSSKFTGKIEKKIHQNIFPSDVILGIRPEDMQISESEANGSIPALVSVVELVGSEKIVFSSVGDQPIISRISPDRELEINKKVYLIINESKMHLFDKKSGDALF